MINLNNMQVGVGEPGDSCIVFSLFPLNEPLITIQADGSILIEGKPCQDGDGIMAAFGRFGQSIKDEILAEIPKLSGDTQYWWVKCYNHKQEETFRIDLDGTFVWRGRPIGKDLRTARAIVGIAQYK